MRFNMVLGRCWGYGFSFAKQLCKDFKVKPTSRSILDMQPSITLFRKLWFKRGKEKVTVLLTKPVFILQRGFSLFLNDLKLACLDSWLKKKKNRRKGKLYFLIWEFMFLVLVLDVKLCVIYITAIPLTVVLRSWLPYRIDSAVDFLPQRQIMILCTYK